MGVDHGAAARDLQVGEKKPAFVHPEAGARLGEGERGEFQREPAQHLREEAEQLDLGEFHPGQRGVARALEAREVTRRALGRQGHIQPTSLGPLHEFALRHRLDLLARAVGLIFLHRPDRAGHVRAVDIHIKAQPAGGARPAEGRLARALAARGGELDVVQADVRAGDAAAHPGRLEGEAVIMKPAFRAGGEGVVRLRRGSLALDDTLRPHLRRPVELQRREDLVGLAIKHSADDRRGGVACEVEFQPVRLVGGRVAEPLDPARQLFRAAGARPTEVEHMRELRPEEHPRLHRLEIPAPHRGGLRLRAAEIDGVDRVLPPAGHVHLGRRRAAGEGEPFLPELEPPVALEPAVDLDGFQPALQQHPVVGR